jgi:hypothetical protein
MPRISGNRPSRKFAAGVFINCPFDAKYKPLFDCLVFTTIYCGYLARSAREIDDGSQVRIDKIFKIIEESRFGIHDLSRTELDDKSKLPRFNMPLELGIFLGAKRYGVGVQRSKYCLVLDRSAYRYQKFISDIAGQDIRAHSGGAAEIISNVRDWLRSASGRSLPGGAEIYRQYIAFKKAFPRLCRRLKLKPAEATFNDFTNIATEWLKERLAVVKTLRRKR